MSIRGRKRTTINGELLRLTIDSGIVIHWDQGYVIVDVSMVEVPARQSNHVLEFIVDEEVEVME